MKIKTITCHDVYNYGASLQAFALQEFLSKRGHDVKIIDYKPDYLSFHYKLTWFVTEQDFKSYKHLDNYLYRTIYVLYRFYVSMKSYKRKLSFDKFKREYLKVTSNYSSINELINNPPKADVYIAGSDQIWNANLKNGKDPAFYLQFGSSRIRRLSYAASFAGSKLDNKELKEQIAQYLKSFSAISVRENTGLNNLQEVGVHGCQVLDPVFLLTQEQWTKSLNIKKKEGKRYILIYDLFGFSDDIKKKIIDFSIKNNLEIKAVTAYHKVEYASENISNAGPREFVELISNAEYVVSNSFHATAFSLIFKKSFCVFLNNTNNTRMQSILQIANLTSCLNPEVIPTNFSWDTISDSMQVELDKSIQFLVKSLENDLF